jgi:hypothetical protein
MDSGTTAVAEACRASRASQQTKTRFDLPRDHRVWCLVSGDLLMRLLRCGAGIRICAFLHLVLRSFGQHVSSIPFACIYSIHTAL